MLQGRRLRLRAGEAAWPETHSCCGLRWSKHKCVSLWEKKICTFLNKMILSPAMKGEQSGPSSAQSWGTLTSPPSLSLQDGGVSVRLDPGGQSG